MGPVTFEPHCLHVPVFYLTQTAPLLQGCYCWPHVSTLRLQRSCEEKKRARKQRDPPPIVQREGKREGEKKKRENVKEITLEKSCPSPDFVLMSVAIYSTYTDMLLTHVSTAK